MQFKKLSFGIGLVLLFSLGGCSSYRSSFRCGDASGAFCMPMDKVDRLIANGEIEKITETCKGRKCKKNKQEGLLQGTLPVVDFGYSYGDESGNANLNGNENK